MCNYSLHLVAARPAKVGDKLVATDFANSITRGFAAVGEPGVAVCLLSGTELAFEKRGPTSPHFQSVQGVAGTQGGLVPAGQYPHVHHEALEFPAGQVMVTRLVAGQTATVLQLPGDRT